MRAKYLIAIVAILALLVAASPAMAFKLMFSSSGNPMKWPVSELGFLVNVTDGPAASLNAINTSMDTWSNVSTADFDFVNSGSTTSKDHGNGDGVSIICFDNMGDNGVLGLNTMWYDPETGEIVDSDIGINTAYAWSTTGEVDKYDLQSVVTHELGHSLFLDDLYSATDVDKTMYGYGDTGETHTRSLHQDDIDGISFLYPLAGHTGAVGPEINISDSVAPIADLQIPFGMVNRGNTVSAVVTIGNYGSSDLTLGVIAQDNRLLAPFSIMDNNCSSLTLAPQTFCTLQVVFAPTSAGSYTDSFNIPSSDTDESTVTINVSGTGASTTAPEISVTDSLSHSSDQILNFGNLIVNNSTSATVTVMNIGSATLTIGTVGADNSLSLPYSIMTDGCSGQSLQPSGSCTLRVGFAPTQAGTFTETFSIPSNDSDEPSVIITASGSASTTTLLPDVAVTDSMAPITDLSIPFGSIANAATKDEIVTLTNSGNAPLQVYAVAIANPISVPFSVIADNCSNTLLVPLGSCTFGVRFAPVNTGYYADTFSISTNDPDESVVTFSISGTSVSTDVPDISLNDTSSPSNDQIVDFGTLTVGASAQTFITLSNAGSAALTVYSVGTTDSLGWPFKFESISCDASTPLSPGSSCGIVVSFNPTAAGSFSDKFSIVSNDPDSGAISFTVKGTGSSTAVNRAPSAPYLVSPDNTSSGMDTVVAFKWNRATDPEGDALTYKLFVCTNSSFTGCNPVTTVASADDGKSAKGVLYAGSLVLFVGMAAAGLGRRRLLAALAIIAIAMMLMMACSGSDSGGSSSNGGNGGGGNGGTATSDYSIHISGLSTGTMYYWRVAVEDIGNNMTYSEIRSFSTR